MDNSKTNDPFINGYELHTLSTAGTSMPSYNIAGAPLTPSYGSIAIGDLFKEGPEDLRLKKMAADLILGMYPNVEEPYNEQKEMVYQWKVKGYPGPMPIKKEHVLTPVEKLINSIDDNEKI